MAVVMFALLNVPLSWSRLGVEGSTGGLRGTGRAGTQLSGRQGLEYLLRQNGDVMTGLLVGGRAPNADLREMVANGKSRGYCTCSIIICADL